MAQDSSKKVENQFLYARLLTHTVATSKDRLSGALTDLMSSKDAKPVMEALDVLTAHVGAERERYASALSTLNTEEGQDESKLEALQATQDALLEACRAARGTLSSGFGEQALTGFALDQPPPIPRDALGLYTRTALDRLHATPRTATNAFGMKIDTAPVAALLTQRVEAFEQARDALSEESKQTQHGRDERDRAAETFQGALIHSAQVIEGALRLGGLDYIADRIRPTRARVTGTEQVDPLPPTPDSPQP